MEIVAGTEKVWLSAAAAESFRFGLAGAIRALGEPETDVSTAALAALEVRWPVDLLLDAPPYATPEARDLVARAAEALALDLARPRPALVPGVDWARLDPAARIGWIERGIRIARGLGRPDLTAIVASQLPADEATALRTALGTRAAPAPYR